MIDELGFSGNPRVAPEERGERLSCPRVRQPRNDAVFVDVVARVDQRHIGWREDVQRHPVARPAQGAAHHVYRYAPFRGGALAVGVGTTVVGLARVEDFPNRKLRDDAEATTDMVAVRRRQNR